MITLKAISMKRFFTFLVLLFFSLNFLGFYSYYAFRLVEIRKESKAQLQYLPEHQLSKFIFTQRAYEEVKRGDDEIQVEGRMYDLARLEVHADSVTVFALHDAAEDNLISFLQTVLQRSATDKKPIPATVIQIFGLTYLGSFFEWKSQLKSSEVGHTEYTFSAATFSPQHRTPPPRLV
jgi:hypothetical protein